MSGRTLFVLLLTVSVAAGFLAAADVTSPALREMVDAERRFAATCAEQGIRDSFLTFFADDVVTFGRGLQVGKEHLRSRKSVDPLRFRLQWLPVYGDIAAAGDLGYLTGPFLLKDSKGEAPAQRGYYFSVWTKQQGAWKVAVDFGVDSPKAEFEPDTPFQLAPQIANKKSHKDDPVLSRESLLSVETAFSQTSATNGFDSAVCGMGAPSILYYSDGEGPHRGRDAACGQRTQDNRHRTYKLRGASVSASGDMGFAYGDYESLPESARGGEGAFLRVWKRTSTDRWEVVAMVHKAVH